VVQSISFQPVSVAIDEDGDDGRLVFADGRLAAVVTRLQSGIHRPEDQGKWHVEAGFGPCAFHVSEPLFASLDDVAAWISRCLAEAHVVSRTSNGG
jgi:hypothetical protein